MNRPKSYNEYADAELKNLSEKSYVVNLEKDNLKKENKKLKTELHKLRKIQAGWFGRGNKQEIEEVRIQNNYYVKENNTLITEINDLKSENLKLANKIKMFETQNAKLKGDYEGFKSEQLKIFNSKIKNLKTGLNAERSKIRSEVEREGQRRMGNKDREYESVISQLRANLDSKERENRRYMTEINRHKSSVNEIKNRANSITNIEFEKSTRILKSQKNDLDKTLKNKSVEIEQLNKINEELRSRILKIDADHSNHECEYYHLSDQQRIQETEKIISLYKQKLDEKNDQNSKLKQLNESLKDQIHQYKITKNEINITKQYQNSDKNNQIRVANDQLKLQNNFLSKEISKYKEIISNRT